MTTRTSADDRILVKRMLAGEEPAFQQFFALHFAPLYRFALRRLRDATAAEEAVQATLGRAVSKLEGYRGEATLLTWLCTFCRHEIAAHLQRKGSQPETIDLLEELPEVRAALESLEALWAADPESALNREEVRRLVHATLDRLPRRFGDALEWKYIEGLSVREVAERLRVGPKAAESLLTRAREAFRDAFLATGGEGAWRPSGAR